MRTTSKIELQWRSLLGAHLLACTSSQTLSLNRLGSFEALENDDSQATATTALVLRFLPFMLGWFAMNAPSGR